MNDETKLVVCVEDEPEMIDLIRLILTRRGFEVIGANGGKDGLEAIGRLCLRSMEHFQCSQITPITTFHRT